MSTNPPPVAADDVDPTIHDPRQRRAILIADCIALMAVIASVTGLNVAQPDLAVEFDASQSDVLWFINVYIMSLAALLLPFDVRRRRAGAGYSVPEDVPRRRQRQPGPRFVVRAATSVRISGRLRAV